MTGNIKRCCIAIALLAICALLAACTPAPVTGMQKVSLSEAEKLVREYIFTETPGMNPDAQFPLTETTTNEVWEKMGCQAFKVTEGVRCSETYVICGNKVYPIGRGFGGPGVVDMAVSDLNADNNPEMAFTFAWGSGFTRSQAGILYFEQGHALHADAAFSYTFNADLRIKTEGGKTLLIDGENGTVIGQLKLETAKEPVLSVELRSGLPEETRKQIWMK